MRKNKIAIFIDWFTPAYKAGGPITSVSNIVDNLYLDFDFYLITSDRDLRSTTPHSNIEFNTWIKTNNYNVIYLSPDKQTQSRYKQLLKEQEFDFIYFNSLYSLKFTLLPLYVAKKIYAKEKIILAPRGMLGEKPIQIKSTKKNIFLKVAKLINFFKGIIWHSTDNYESSNIKKFFGTDVKIIQVANIPKINNTLLSNKDFNIIRFVYYSRISPIKNLDFILEILQEIKTKIEFHIIGPIEDTEYWAECQKQIKKLRSNISVEYHKHINPTEIFSTLSNYHFSILATKHENFGHSIFESFMSGCPVIISDQTPWKNLAEKNIGWDISLSDKTSFIKVIEKCSTISAEEYNQMSKNIYNFAHKFIKEQNIIENTKKLFQ